MIKAVLLRTLLPLVVVWFVLIVILLGMGVFTTERIITIAVIGGIVTLALVTQSWYQLKLEKTAADQDEIVRRRKAEYDAAIAAQLKPKIKALDDFIHWADALLGRFEYILHNHFNVRKCGKCNGSVFEVLRFNGEYTAYEVRCETCEKKSWFKASATLMDGHIEDLMGVDLLSISYAEVSDLNSDERKYINENSIELPTMFIPDEHIVYVREHKVEQHASRHISSTVKREVWRRDQGRCIQCGSQENLEYDHIIPFSKGGSNTARNIQLLCESCNRSKQASIA